MSSKKLYTKLNNYYNTYNIISNYYRGKDNLENNTHIYRIIVYTYYQYNYKKIIFHYFYYFY